jgi:hypothetical protein
MQVNNLLNVAIVMAAVYIALSCVCSSINEQIASLFRLRGEKLYTGVLNMVFGNKAFVDALFSHPLIDSASNNARGFYNPFKSKENRPSYIDARAFTLAFWDSVSANAGKVGADAKALRAEADRLEAKAKSAANPAAAPGEADQAQLRATQATSIADWAEGADKVVQVRTDAIDALRTAAKAGAARESAEATLALAQQLVTAPADLLANLRAAAQRIPDPSLRSSLSALFVGAGDDYTKLLKATDDWFNAQMERVSGWYTRQAQFILIAIAAVVVILTGIDSIELAEGLYGSPSLAATADLVSKQYSSAAQGAGSVTPGSATEAQERAATKDLLGNQDIARFFHPDFVNWLGTFNADWRKEADQHKSQVGIDQHDVQTARDAVAAATAAESVAEKVDVDKAERGASQTKPANHLAVAEQTLAHAQDRLVAALKKQAVDAEKVQRDERARTPLQHLPGMLITLFALSLGGPFWFDALGKLVNVRAAGVKPANGTSVKPTTGTATA